MLRLRPFSAILPALAASLVLSVAHSAPAAATLDPRTSSAEALDDTAAWQRFKALASRSSDLRVRVAMSTPDYDELNGLYMQHPDTAIEALVEQARGSTDPVVLWLLTARCSAFDSGGRHPCDAIDMARRWTVADTQNQLAWLTFAQALDVAGAQAEARTAIVRGAQASTWREDQVTLARTIAGAVPTDEMTPRQRVETLRAVQVIGFGTATPLRILSKSCRESGLRDACLRYLETIARDADNLASVRIGAIYSGRIGAPDDVVRVRIEHADAWMYALTKMGVRDDTEIDEAVRAARDDIEHSEAFRARRALARAHLTEAEAARRLVAELSPAQREYRAAAMRPVWLRQTPNDAADSR